MEFHKVELHFFLITTQPIAKKRGQTISYCLTSLMKTMYQPTNPRTK